MASPKPRQREAGPLRIMVVDDSAVIRGLLTRTLESDPGIAVVASAGNGQMALDALKRHDVEVALLDMAMPVMDGMTALPLLMAARPDLKVIVVSTLTSAGAALTMRALAAGAADYLMKPSAAALAGGARFRRDLLAKVTALGEAARSLGGLAAPSRAAADPAVSAPGPALRAMPTEPPQALAIGASTGGPMALNRIVAALGPAPRQPIFVTQHMPPTFTAILADHLTRASGRHAAEGIDGEPIAQGRIYVAPGDFHMLVEAAPGGAKRIRLTKSPPENYCRPSVDPMLRSLAEAYGKGVVCAILTGMGQDGLKGAGALVASGGAVIAQDQATSVVWGMPGAVAAAGLVSAVLPLERIGPTLARIAVAP